MIVAYSFTTGVRDYRHKKALKINAELEIFKMENGTYPKNLIQLKSDVDIDGLKYTTDSAYTKYELEYLMDGFDREIFDSYSKEWSTLGWND